MLDASQREEEGMHLTEHTRDFISRCVTEQDAWSTLQRLCEEVGARLSASAEERRAMDPRWLGLPLPRPGGECVEESGSCGAWR